MILLFPSPQAATQVVVEKEGRGSAVQPQCLELEGINGRMLGSWRGGKQKKGGGKEQGEMSGNGQTAVPVGVESLGNGGWRGRRSVKILERLLSCVTG